MLGSLVLSHSCGILIPSSLNVSIGCRLCRPKLAFCHNNSWGVVMMIVTIVMAGKATLTLDLYLTFRFFEALYSQCNLKG